MQYLIFYPSPFLDYVKQRDNQAIIFLNVINKDDRLKHIAVDEDYDTVAAMLNS